MCYTRADEGIEYEALRRAEEKARKKGQANEAHKEREKKPLSEKVKEMIGAR